MAVATLGAFVVVAGVLGLVSIYLGAVTQATSGVQRTASLPEYDGRPSVQEADGNRPIRYLVLVTDENDTLSSAYLAQLSGSRDALHLVGVPENLLVTDSLGRDATLAAQFRLGAAQAVRSMESLLDVRIDHLVQVDLDGFTGIIDVLGGVTVDNRMETAADGWHFDAGELRLKGAEALVYLGSPKQTMSRLERSQAVFVEILRGLVSGDALTNPAKVEAIGEVLNSCVVVDAALTAGEIRRMALDMHLSSDAIAGTPLPLAGVTEVAGKHVVVADHGALKILSDALRADRVSQWAAARPQPWESLDELPPR